ncbi:hypothetical protein STEG23_028277, partial [Scotinomys teguina]
GYNSKQWVLDLRGRVFPLDDLDFDEIIQSISQSLEKSSVMTVRVFTSLVSGASQFSSELSVGEEIFWICVAQCCSHFWNMAIEDLKVSGAAYFTRGTPQVFGGDKPFLVTSSIAFSSGACVLLSLLPVIDDLASILPSGKTQGPSPTNSPSYSPCEKNSSSLSLTGFLELGLVLGCGSLHLLPSVTGEGSVMTVRIFSHLITRIGQFRTLILVLVYVQVNVWQDIFDGLMFLTRHGLWLTLCIRISCEWIFLLEEPNVKSDPYVP